MCICSVLTQGEDYSRTGEKKKRRKNIADKKEK